MIIESIMLLSALNGVLSTNIELPTKQINEQMQNRDAASQELIRSFDIVNNSNDYEYFDPDSYPKHNTILNSQDFLLGTQIGRSVIGDDERYLIDNPKSQAYIKTGYIIDKIFNVYNNNTGLTEPLAWSGTGFLVGPNLMLTAGHCMYKDATKTRDGNTAFEDNIFNPRVVDEVEVYFGIENNNELTSSYPYYAKGVKIYLQDSYCSYLQRNYDWALVELDRNIGNEIGWYNLTPNWNVTNGSLFSVGYPGDKPTATMWRTNGHFKGITGYQYYNDLDTYGGQSGSPYFVIDQNLNKFVCGIHTYGADYTEWNEGTIINNLIYAFVDSFFHYHNYLHMAAEILPTDYNFSDSYPVDQYTSTVYRDHYLTNGFHFQTRRYRTGYIHNEYVVMSSIRRNINRAFIEYNFDVPIIAIQVEMAHWRPHDHELLNPSTGTLVIRYLPDPDDYEEYTTIKDFFFPFDILTTDRTNPDLITQIMPNITTFQFYTDNNMTNTNDSNRGRVCIGSLKVFTTEGEY